MARLKKDVDPLLLLFMLCVRLTLQGAVLGLFVLLFWGRA